MSRIDTEEFDAPAHWASAFINGDCTGLDDTDQTEFDAWCEANPELCNVVDCSEESFIGRFNGLQTDLLTYTCHILEGNKS
jgi:hypothetical protein